MQYEPVCNQGWLYICERFSGNTFGDGSHLWSGSVPTLNAGECYYVAFAVEGYGSDLSDTDTVGTMRVEMQLLECA